MSLIIQDLREKPEHLPTLAQWHHDEWNYLNPGQTLEDRLQIMQDYLNDEFVPSTWFAELNGELAGSAAILESDMEHHPEYTPWLASVFVFPDFRCQGIGSELVRHVVEQAGLQDIETVYLFTPDQEQLYENLDWQSFSIENYRGCDVTLMRYLTDI